MDKDLQVLLVKAVWHSLQASTLQYERHIYDLQDVAKDKPSNPLQKTIAAWNEQLEEAEKLMGQLERTLIYFGEGVQ